MFDFKQDFFSYNFVLKFSNVWCHKKMALILNIYFIGKTSLLSHHIMRKEKKGKPPFFPHPRNNSLKKKTHYPSQYHLIKLLHFSSSSKPPHLKKTL